MIDAFNKEWELIIYCSTIVLCLLLRDLSISLNSAIIVKEKKDLETTPSRSLTSDRVAEELLTALVYCLLLGREGKEWSLGNMSGIRRSN